MFLKYLEQLKIQEVFVEIRLVVLNVEFQTKKSWIFFPCSVKTAKWNRFSKVCLKLIRKRCFCSLKYSVSVTDSSLFKCV